MKSFFKQLFIFWSIRLDELNASAWSKVQFILTYQARRQDGITPSCQYFLDIICDSIYLNYSLLAECFRCVCSLHKYHEYFFGQRAQILNSAITKIPIG